MDYEINESESMTCANSYSPNPVLFIVHMKAGYMFGSRSDVVLSRERNASAREANTKMINTMVDTFNQAFSNNSKTVFTGRSYECRDIEKIEILDGNGIGKDILATVINPNAQQN